MTVTPPCRVCRSSKWVAIYREDAPGETICPECCGGDVLHPDGETGHQFEYEPGEGHCCVYCGVRRDHLGPDYDPGPDD